MRSNSLSFRFRTFERRPAFNRLAVIPSQARLDSRSSRIDTSLYFTQVLRHRKGSRPFVLEYHLLTLSVFIISHSHDYTGFPVCHHNNPSVSSVHLRTVECRFFLRHHVSLLTLRSHTPVILTLNLTFSEYHSKRTFATAFRFETRNELH